MATSRIAFDGNGAAVAANSANHPERDHRMLAAVIASCAIAAAGGTRLVGTVRSAADSLPLAGAIVNAEGAGTTHTATDGSYELRSLATGTCTLVVTRTGFRTATVNVVLGSASSTRVDFVLEPEPVEIPRVLVTAARERADTAPHGTPLGGWHVTHPQAISALATAEPDPLRDLARTPAGRPGSESPAVLSIRGGAGDENLVLLDGIPLVNATHGAGSLGAVAPLALAEVTLDGAAPPAEYGGRLSSVVRLRTIVPRPGRYVARASIGTIGMGVVAGTALPGGASVLVSGRRSFGALGTASRTGEGGEPGISPGWTDMLVTTSISLARDTVTFLAFGAHDAVLFGAPSGDAPGEASANSTGGGSDLPVSRIHWGSSATGMTWRHGLGANTALDWVLWRSSASAGVDWLGPLPTTAMGTTVHTGTRAAIAWRGAHEATRVGVALERMHPRYYAARATGTLTLDGRTRLASIFADQTWTPSAVLRLHGGVRATIAATDDAVGRAPAARTRTLVEPRLSAEYSPVRRVTLAAGYARTHQYAQSVWNEESPVAAIVGLDVGAPAGSGGIPIATSDVGSASASFSGTRYSVTVDAYTRRLTGLALGGNPTPEPFATARPLAGTGRAWGIGAAGTARLGRVTLDAAAAYEHVVRSVGGRSYRPAFAPTLTMAGAVAYRATNRTTLTAAARLEDGRRATLIAGPVQWRWSGGLFRHRELNSAPYLYAGAPAELALPRFTRIDLGVMHRVALAGRRQRGNAIVFAAIDNVLGRANTLGFATGGPGVRTRLPMLPRSVRAGAMVRF